MISVIIPTYNRGSRILASVDSVLSQTYRDIELIIVDDGSTDDTESVIKGIKDERVRYARQNNQGACAARNYGIRLAKGDYIAFQDSDDQWYKEKLEKQIRFLEEMDADVVFCKMLEKCGSFERVVPANIKEGRLGYRDSLMGIGTQSLFMKAAIAEQNAFDIDFPRLQDLEWILRANEKYKIYCMDEVLVDYIIGEDSISASGEKLYRACRLLLEKDRDLIKKYPQLRKKLADNLKKEGYIIKKGKREFTRKKECVKYFALAFRLFRSFLNVKAFCGGIKCYCMISH